jgi:GNAT superfamily N-acetyltransferase
MARNSSTPRNEPGARLATHDDIPGIMRLVADYWFFEGIDGFDADTLSAQLDHLLSNRRLGDVWVAASPDALVGYLVAVYVFSLEHKGLVAEIDEFYVIPAGRGRGVGHALLAAAEARFLELRCTNVSLQLGRGNDSARRFYHGHGYRDRAGFELLDKMLTNSD